jgi:hypothetical protein
VAARAKPQDGQGVSFETLLIAAVASATAAIVVSRFWRAGTPIAAAVTPVVVSLVSEAIRRPMKSEVVRRPVRRAASLGATPVRRYRTGEQPVLAPRGREGRAGERAAEPRSSGDAGPRDRRERATEPLMDATNGRDSEPAYNVYGSGRPERPGWRERLSRNRVKVALVTGVLAFALAVAALTVPELIFGGSVSGTDSNTTFFGGGGKEDDRDKGRGDERDGGDREEGGQDRGGDADKPSPDRPSGSAPEQDGGEEAPSDEPPAGEEPPQDSPPGPQVPAPPEPPQP